MHDSGRLRPLPLPAMAQSFHKASRPIAQRTGRPKLFGVDVEEGIGGRLGRSDPRTPGVIFEPGRPGTPRDAGRTRLGPSHYIGCQESRDSSTAVSINPLLFPSILPVVARSVQFRPDARRMRAHLARTIATSAALDGSRTEAVPCDRA